MKPFRPFLMVTVGPLLLAMGIVAVTFIVLPGYRSLIALFWTGMVSVAVGLVVFGPPAVILAIKNRHPNWLHKYSYRIAWYTSMFMATSMGYLAAVYLNARPGGSDPLIFPAFAVIFLGAVVKATLIRLG